MPLRGRPRAARPSPRVDRTRLPATAALDGWPSPPGPQGPEATEPGVQADSSALTTLYRAVMRHGAPPRHQGAGSRRGQPSEANDQRVCGGWSTAGATRGALMDITGYSSEFITDHAFPEAVKRFALRQARRWPGLLLDGRWVAAESLGDWHLPENAEDDYSSIVTFSGSRAMEEFWECHGYALNDQGEGPFSVLYKRYPGALRAHRVSGAQLADPENSAVVEGASLLLSECFAVSLVTPEDPGTDPFSGGVLRDFLDSFSR
ncbi:hypothetical protein SAMN05428945_3331 [Streptomyces sp. 2224.1]|nr:hypothetical protein BX261_1995 [Streptomyces sp. 2321.6]SDR51410.1 hypothetical protein SAMN05216511_5217 [Streptomyces sp. KS_16]SEC44032.1 hypothetical protein SAMN05428940_1996 [Streptomyces sp. 2133.1]SEC59640.1 hypothetical protein SAMN05428945_3331 [Streptomyces sp. 2224.1]SNC67481.1 hypothetical protein SAMN06272741_1993 [Streptomyces sp. 2114.4]